MLCTSWMCVICVCKLKDYTIHTQFISLLYRRLKTLHTTKLLPRQGPQGVQIMARTEPPNEDGSPHIAKLEVEHEMEDKMAQKKQKNSLETGRNRSF